MQQTKHTLERSEAGRRRVEAVVETLANVRSQGGNLAELAHDAGNMVTALDLYFDLLEGPGVLATPYLPLQVNFALSGTAPLVREIRAALHRREREEALARRAAAMENELKSTVAGLPLKSQLALSGSESSPIADKLRLVADLAANLRQQLSAPLPVRSDTAA